MKNLKLLLILTLVLPAFAMNVKQQQAAKDLSLAIENCHNNDGQHQFRIEEFIKSSYDLPARECKPVLDLHAELVKNKSELNQCGNCKDIERFIAAGIQELSKSIQAGKGHMSVADLASETKKQNK